MIAQTVTTHKQRGDYGEALACRYLKDRGFEIVAQNYMPQKGIKRGEIDIIAQKDSVIHFVEVKARFVRGGVENIDPPELRITRTKLQALERTAQRYLVEQNLQQHEYCFDAVSVVYETDTKTARIRFLRDLFL